MVGVIFNSFFISLCLLAIELHRAKFPDIEGIARDPTKGPSAALSTYN